MNSSLLLRGLLNEATSELAKRGLTALASGSVSGYQVTKPVATEEIRQIYSRRAKLNSQKSGTVEGFEELLSALNGETDPDLLIHGFEAGSEAFTVFTNVAITRLIGLLISHV
jgi:hypothetical protein